MHDRRTFLALGAAGLMWPGVARAQTPGKRYALIIGNNKYPASLGELHNAVNDAKLLATVLGLCGFDVPPGALVIDGDKATIQREARAHADRLAAAGPDAMGFVYYSGHGAARPAGDNYLIPIVDASLDIRTASVWDSSIGVDWLLRDALANLPAPQIIAIDACRSELRTSERGVGGSGTFVVRGLEVVAGGDDANMFLSFATWQGQTAADGAAADGNGPYALALASSLVEPGPILNLFDEVRRDVKRRTSRQQEVMNVSRLSDEASEIRIGGGIDPAIIPKVGTVDPAGIGRGVWNPVNLALCISCEYAGPRRLPYAGGDADKVASALRDSDFTVTRVVNPAKAAMKAAITRFAADLHTHGKAAVAVLHFAGHSAGLSGVGNFLFANDSVPETIDDLEEGLSLRDIARELRDSDAESVVIFLDAGRQLGIKGTVGKSLAADVVREPGTGNVLIAFCVEPGGFAVAYEGGQSYFAAALADEIRSADRRSVADVMARVRARVSERSRGAMEPSFVANAPIYFRDGRGLVRKA